MLNTIYLIINVIQAIVIIVFIVFLIYSAIKKWYTLKNYKIRMIFSAILCIMNMAEALVGYKLRMSIYTNIFLTGMWLMEVIRLLMVINIERKENDEEVMTEEEEN